MATRSKRKYSSHLSSPLAAKRARPNRTAKAVHEPSEEDEAGGSAQRATERNAIGGEPNSSKVPPRTLRSGRTRSLAVAIEKPSSVATPRGKRALRGHRQEDPTAGTGEENVEDAEEDQDEAEGTVIRVEIEELENEDSPNTEESSSLSSLPPKSSLVDGAQQDEEDENDDARGEETGSEESRVAREKTVSEIGDGERQDGANGDVEQSQRFSITPTSAQSKINPGRKRRQSQKVPFHEPGYQAPGVASPELGGKEFAPSRRGVQQGSIRKKSAARAVERDAEAESENVGAAETDDQEDMESSAEEAEEEDETDDEDVIRQTPQPPDGSARNEDGDNADVTIFIEPPDDSEEPVSIELRSEVLKKLTSQMGFRGWTHESDWVEETLMNVKEKESKQAWLGRQKSVMRSNECLDLMKHLNDLWLISHNMPRAPEFKEQFQYLRGQPLRQCFHDIERSVHLISSEILKQLDLPKDDASRRRKSARKAVKCLYTKVIPMLTLVIKEVFMVGGSTGPKHDRIPLGECEFTATTLQILKRVTGWTRRLYSVMISDLEAHRPKPTTDAAAERANIEIAERRRRQFQVHLDLLNKNLKKARSDLERIEMEPHDQQEAIKRDEDLRVSRQKKEEERRQKQDRQMQLFIESTQRLAQQQRPMNARHTDTRPTTKSALPSRRRMQAEDDGYCQRHGGWFYPEDELLLSMIRKVLRPGIEGLAALFHDRTPEEVKQRVGVLKDRMRAKFVQAGQEPPVWCYHYE